MCSALPLQPDINEKMRAILIDWLVEVHLKFKASSCPSSGGALQCSSLPWSVIFLLPAPREHVIEVLLLQ